MPEVGNRSDTERLGGYRFEPLSMELAQVLVSRGRRVLGVHLWGDVGSALKRLTSMVMAAA